MLLIIDSNIYIFSFGPLKESKSRDLFGKLLEKLASHTIRIPRTIFEEVKRNLSVEAFQEFNKVINDITSVDEDIVVPFELAFKYETMGLKPSDAFIAAYTEWTGAGALVTENRHFLTRRPDLPFKVLTAEKCLKLI